ncbi:MAG: hypothetical protein QUV05_04385 [Phycisphaerae bacterium]|nr:hypothetical protein [Phycisphaerae bacterium]
MITHVKDLLKSKDSKTDDDVGHGPAVTEYVILLAVIVGIVLIGCGSLVAKVSDILNAVAAVMS